MVGFDYALGLFTVRSNKFRDVSDCILAHSHSLALSCRYKMIEQFRLTRCVEYYRGYSGLAILGNNLLCKARHSNELGEKRIHKGVKR